MEKVIRTIISIIISGVVLYGIRSITQNDAPWITAIVSFGCAYPILYSGRSQHLEPRRIKQEYIIDLHNDKLGDLFVPSKYPGYKKKVQVWMEMIICQMPVQSFVQNLLRRFKL